MTATGFSLLYECAKELLDAAAEAVEATPGGPIAHRYVSPGPPAFDVTPQLTVHIGSALEGDTLPLQPSLNPQQRINYIGVVYLVPLTITVLRDAPMIGMDGEEPLYPDPDDMDEAAQLTCADLWGIWNHLATKKRSGELFPPKDRREFMLDPAVPINQQGGACGWAIQVRVQLDGYKAV